MRLLVQCLDTGRFLVPSVECGAAYVSSLREAGGGVISDVEHAVQLVHDYSYFDQHLQIVDLDRLGTVSDY